MQVVSWIKKQTGKISDNFNSYKFYVHQEPQIIDSSSVVSVHTYVSRDMTATVPCSFKWSTVRNNLTTEVTHFKGNTFICQPSDVGSILQVQITSNDPQCTGTAVMNYGPVKFDVLLKKQIQVALVRGQATYCVDLVEGDLIKECQLKVTQEKASLKHSNSETVFLFDYSMVQPKIQAVSKLPNQARIVFSPKYYEGLHAFLVKLYGPERPTQEILRYSSLQLTFSNRKARDSLLYIIKAFNTKKQLKSSSYVSVLEKQLDFSSMLTSNSSSQKNFNYLETISQLQHDIFKLLEITTKNIVEKRTYLQQIQRLEKEIEEIVGTYLKIIEEKFSGREDFEKSFVVLKEKEDEIKQVKQQRQEMIDLENRIRELQEREGWYQVQNTQLKEIIKKLGGQTELSNLRSLPQQQTPFTFKKIKPFEQTEQQIMNTSSHKNDNSGMILNQGVQREEGNSKIMTVTHEENVMRRSRHQGTVQESDRKKVGQFIIENKDMLFDAKSVKSVRGQQNESMLRSNGQNQSNVFQSLMISKDSVLMNSNGTPKKSSQTMQNPSIHQNHQSVNQNRSIPTFTTLVEASHIITELWHQNHQLRLRVSQLTKQSKEYSQKQGKYKKRISELSEELEMHRRNNDMLNRSQHLSMEMEDYHEEKLSLLKKENEFLAGENQKLNELCKKYMVDAKKYKLLKSNNNDQSLLSSVLQQPQLK